ncbi:MAG: acyl-protein synthetase [Coriobacteriia bacterium]
MDTYADTSRRQELADRILRVIEEGPDGDGSAFDELALTVFAYQFEHNAPYREFCSAAQVTPDTVTGWRDIPAYPTDAFKQEIVTSFPFEEAVMAQLTSGTTSANQRGRIFRDELGKRLVLTANRVMTGAYLFPDVSPKTPPGDRPRILILAPSPQMAPSMGMAIGMDQTRKHFGHPDSAFLMSKTGIDVRTLIAALRAAEEADRPLALIGATSAFVYFFRACQRKKIRFDLPRGSRVGDGGGYRGRFGDITRDDYYALCDEVLGVPASHCVNILGMAESATNYFDDTLRRCVLGLPEATRHKVPPPWTRVVAISPDTGDPLPPGEVGLLAHWDLANLPTVLAVQTDNLGATDERGGFEIIGRAKVADGAVARDPSTRTVGPMGDKPLLRLLEAYVNFSIDFKMGRVSAASPKADVVEERRRAEGTTDAQPSCPVVVDELVAGTEDEEARKRAAEALATFGEPAAQEDGDAVSGSGAQQVGAVDGPVDDRHTDEREQDDRQREGGEPR